MSKEFASRRASLLALTMLVFLSHTAVIIASVSGGPSVGGLHLADKISSDDHLHRKKFDSRGINRNLLSPRLYNQIPVDLQSNNDLSVESIETMASSVEVAQMGENKSSAFYPHAVSTDECLRSLQVEASKGLSSEVATHRLKQYGFNKLIARRGKSLVSMLLEQFEDKLVQILLVVATASSVLAVLENDAHGAIEPVVILLILVINAFIGVYQSLSAAGSLEALKKLQPETAIVLRDGTWINEFPAADLVPGDIINVRVGDKIPADARIIFVKTTSCSTDEGSLTGESTTVAKSLAPVDQHAIISSKLNMIFSGTMMTTGACTAVVTDTGSSTEIGKIDAGVQAASEIHTKTPLTTRLDEFADQLTKVIAGICALVWVINIPKFRNPTFGGQWQKGAIYYGKAAVALGVAAIPEGLPAVITMCLSLGTARMAKKNVIVRKLSSVETLGCTSVICTDKTGTLTTNQMTVTSLVAMSLSSESDLKIEEHFVDGVSYEPIGVVHGVDASCLSAESSSSFKDIATICALCSEASIEYSMKDARFVRIGEPTEAALKVLCEKLGVYELSRSPVDPILLASQSSDHWSAAYDRLAMLEFNRDRKSMSVLCKSKRQQDLKGRGGIPTSKLLVKGAAEVVVKRCARVKMENGEILPMTDSRRAMLLSKISEMASRPLRCLAFAYKEGSELGDLQTIDSEEAASQSSLLSDSAKFVEYESDLTLVGFCGIQDPARPEVRTAIQQCRSAGVRVMMMTGDSKETAVAIAKDVSIFESKLDQDPTSIEDFSKSAFTGREFFSLSEEEQLNVLKTGNKVFCRTEPKDKQKLISMLEKLGEITAMTGDGVNDAPALQQADIGIAMGITGTEVSKGAADMILADDNFASIVAAVEEGRNIYSNMQTFICFLISSNIGEITTMLLATLMGIPEPLMPLHLLWVNLVTDGPPATALGFNPSDPNIMKMLPRSKHEAIMSPWMLTRYLITGGYVGCATIGAFIWWYLNKGVTFEQLRNWGTCQNWKDSFLPSFVTSCGFSSAADACDIFSRQIARPQTMALSVLVSIEMLKALSSVSLDSSLLQVYPWKNPWLVVGVIAPFCLHLLVMHTPILGTLFGMSPLSLEEWKVVAAFSLPVILLEELLKYIGRHLEDIKQAALKKVIEAKSLKDRIQYSVPPPHF